MVAEQCGLSIAAVSRALNNRPGISRERAEMVRRVAREMGYQPNEAARLLKTNRSKNIGILYYNLFTHEFFSEVLESIQQEAAEHGYEITFLQNNAGMTYYEHAMRRQCAGVLLVQIPYDKSSMQSIFDSGMPLVSIEYEQPGCTVIRNDNVQAMEVLVRHAHSLGHERIAFIHGELSTVTSQRLAGFHRGCRECGISVPPEFVVARHFRQVQPAADAVKQLLTLPHPPTCVIFPDDICALGGMQAIERSGLHVPQDVSVMGFGGISVVQLMNTPLTTYHQNPREMGRLAVQEIISAIEDPKCYVPHTAIVDGMLMDGDTVSALK